MRTISIINTKSGCSKTTTAINLACTLGWKGLKVLLIDIDPQGHASMSVNLQCENELSIYELFTEQASIEKIIIKYVVAGIDMIQANMSLVQFENHSSYIDHSQALACYLENVEYMYDYVIIDCPPKINYLSNNALLASDEVIIPLEMSLFSLESINKLTSHISEVENCSGVTLPFLILPTMVDYRTRLARTFLNIIRQQFPDNIFPFIIHNTVSKSIPIIDYDADSITTDDFKLLANEIIQRDDIRVDDIRVA